MDNDSSPLSSDWEISTEKIENFEPATKGSKESAGSEEEGDYRGRTTAEEEPPEAEIVADKNSEEYKDELTGVKIKYTLTPGDVKRYIRHSRSFQEHRKTKLKYAAFQSALLFSLLVITFATELYYCAFLALVPLFALAVMLVVSHVDIESSSKKLLKDTRYTIDIFPDRLEVETENGKRTIYLDGSFVSDENKDLILISKEGQTGVVIPLRAVEPDLRADVQAMIAAGCTPL